ncbi:hypothetical protein CVT24_010030 [Panaeolus cyanescens]|uniref:RNA-dependent RNA polymerase n=1 Tax=Panaeolus cyanescens TaxID=181874 RepID=A0A409W3V9_9AGAR|nr:hypothetical protein CVT24_010030 [Panaeolus cyanescens]
MEIFMQRVPPHVTETQLTMALASVLHGPLFNYKPINFHVCLFPPKKERHGPEAIHSGCGALTLPDETIGEIFLDDDAVDLELPPICRQIIFKYSSHPPRENVVQRIRLLPFQDPRIEETKRMKKSILDEEHVPINAVQFCWKCRDGVLSIEWEEHCVDRSRLRFDYDNREIRIEIDAQGFQDGYLYWRMLDNEDEPDDIDDYDDMEEGEEDIHVPANLIVIPYSTVEYVSAHLDDDQVPAIYMRLSTSPKYEFYNPSQTRRTKLSSLSIRDHFRVAPFVSYEIRLTCNDVYLLEKFRDLAETATFQNVSYDLFTVDRNRGRFSQTALDALDAYLKRFSWRVAFQLQGLLCSGLVDAKEVIEVLPALWNVQNKKGKLFAAQLAQQFWEEVRDRDSQATRDEDDSGMVLADLFASAERNLGETPVVPLTPTEGSHYYAFHVTITPTSMQLEGPVLDQSNRVIRRYHPDNHDCFLRVNFVDEMGLHYRFNREVNGPSFIRDRVGTFLKSGLYIAGRKFDFLAYSQSALKDHSVWFVKPFKDPKYGEVDAKTIIQSIGDFTGPKCDPSLIYCPARYAARLSQAFTATDAVNVEVEEILMAHDIEVTTPTGTTYQFTDGVGTMSDELAQAIWHQLKPSKKPGCRRKPHPKAYQIRFRGSKGMLSVDYKLKGMAMTLRPSMVKFDTHEDDMTIEIARAFDRPNYYFLNRPLIMLMEDLGVPYSTFKKYQDRAVKETQDATRSFKAAAQLMDSYGLGTAYCIPSILLRLSKPPFNMTSLLDDGFYQKMLTHAMNHVLRLLKTKAAIPVPGAWTLVGVADVHKQLYPNEIFAHIRTLGGKNIYLEGPVLVSRSPTIHPGDLTIVHAIGKPPKGSCFESESLRNTVVFSVKGDRPIPSGLGGGDLDGDTYNLIPLNDLPEFRPKTVVAPAEYSPVPKKLLDRPSTMDDVADFVVEFIYSDVVGIVANNWLIIADQSEEGISDRDCLELAEIHSQAVDYPKSGKAVDGRSIPRLKHENRPDWSAPETVDIRKGSYYVSHRAIGRLFRAIDLPAERSGPRPPSQPKCAQSVQELVENSTNFNVENEPDELYRIVEEQVEQYTNTSGPFDGDAMNEIVWLFKRYSYELHNICCTTTLSRHRKSQLTEEEAVVGTISEKTSQPRRRIELMSKLRERTTRLAQVQREGIEGDDIVDVQKRLDRCWMAFQLAKANKSEFGAQSFGWIALGCILDTIEEIEEESES